ncbi:MAG TPA: acyl-CoA dehydrogenase family protein [Limnochordales bacterium]
MGRAFLEAVVHAARPGAFGQRLIHYPMVHETLLDMLAAWEAGLASAFAAGAAWEAWLARGDRESLAWQRLVTALAKYRTAEDAVRSASRAIEMLGGNGYAEDPRACCGTPK